MSGFDWLRVEACFGICVSAGRIESKYFARLEFLDQSVNSSSLGCCFGSEK
jgi:hypothetical protein